MRCFIEPTLPAYEYQPTVSAPEGASLSYSILVAPDVAQGQVVADQLLGFSTEYAGAETMNSLRHLGLPLIAAGRHQGDGELCLRRDGALRKITVGNGRIVGYRLVGDIRGAGILRSLMLRGTAIAGIERALMSPRLEFAGLNPALFSRAA